MADTQKSTRRRPTSSQNRKQPYKKMPQLTSNTRVSKRPLHRPAIPSPYANANSPKTIYISARTPFLSAIKRGEKLLHLADKRLVQAATTNTKHAGPQGKRKRNGGDEDEVLGIAEEVERLKEEGRRGKKVKLEGRDGDGGVGGESVVYKGTGRAIERTLELAGWFLQRGDVYHVRLRTGTVSGVDDLVYEEKGDPETSANGDDKMEDSGSKQNGDMEQDEGGVAVQKEEAPTPETRVRRIGVLEVAVSLK